MIGQSVRIVWPGGEHDFKFAIGELRALEQRLDCGCPVVMARLFKAEFKIDDIYEVLRIGLQGGGMSEKQAVAVIQSAFPHANLFDLAVTAARVLAQFISWPTDKDSDSAEEVKSGEAQATTTSSPSPTENSDGRGSSEPLQ